MIALHCECYGNNFCHWNLSHGTHSSISAITFFFWIHLVTNFGSILCFALSTGAIIFTIMNIIGLIMGCKWGVDPPVKAPPDALTSRAHPLPPRNTTSNEIHCTARARTSEWGSGNQTILKKGNIQIRPLMCPQT